MGEALRNEDQKIAWAVYRALKRVGEGAYVGKPKDDGTSVIDGSFEYAAVAAALRRALQDEGLVIMSARIER